MTDTESRDLSRLLTRLLREPEAALHPEWRRAANLLMSSRPDATAALLRRVVTLEATLAQAAAATQPPGHASIDGAALTSAPPAAPDAPRYAAAPARSLLRDATAVAAGVVGGGLVLGALDAVFDGDDDLSGLID